MSDVLPLQRNIFGRPNGALVPTSGRHEALAVATEDHPEGRKVYGEYPFRKLPNPPSDLHRKAVIPHMTKAGINPLASPSATR